MVGKAPFGALETVTAVKLCVSFLFETPRVWPPLPLVSSREALELVALTRLEAFVVSRRKANGFYGFPNNFIEQALGVAATTRNVSTLKKIVAFARAEPAR
jgi:hypothetical protein